MFSSLGLVLLSALVAVGAERVNINAQFDRFVEQFNEHKRELGKTSSPQPEIPVGAGVRYPDSIILGLDSLHRTDDCWQEAKGQNTSFDIHYGLQFLTVVMPHLEIDGKNMSAYARVRDNSFHLRFTKRVEGSECSVILNELRVERMGKVAFEASRPEFDTTDLDGYFKKVVVPALNKIIDLNLSVIEANLQYICKLGNVGNNVPIPEMLLDKIHN